MFGARAYCAEPEDVRVRSRVYRSQGESEQDERVPRDQPDIYAAHPDFGEWEGQYQRFGGDCRVSRRSIRWRWRAAVPGGRAGAGQGAPDRVFGEQRDPAAAEQRRACGVPCC
ncbi:hypothetical protein AYI69_g2323 [Smittium culicis]|uniref:Uncharacterized protein n=1 Tax=Smittium culicis TaxID=133412 RepID=A0A1R1YMS1_9FUNG|nr:hypothetical protein AYI69_g2323 [Smittium culicis]